MIPQAEAYLRVARRSLDAAAALVPGGIQEAAGFYAYHAFESLGGAINVHHNHQPPKYSGHAAKIKSFQADANAHAFGGDVSLLAVTVQALRNDLLYPSDPQGGLSDTPDDRYSMVDAQDLIADVESLYVQIAQVVNPAPAALIAVPVPAAQPPTP